MSDAPQSVRGMNDLLPPESAKWQHLEHACREVFRTFGYGEARPPSLVPFRSSCDAGLVP